MSMSTHGGVRSGPGRKPKNPAERAVARQVTLLPAEWAALEEMSPDGRPQREAVNILRREIGLRGIRSQLERAGYSKSHVEAVSAIYGAFGSTMSEMSGMTPEKWLESHLDGIREVVSSRPFSGEAPSLRAVRQRYEGTDEWLMAPNGKPSRLPEKLWLMARTPEFKAWFGDWEREASSSVLDENGEPMVCWHGSRASVDRQFSFSHKFIGTHGSGEGYGFYFTTDESTARGYAKKSDSLVSAFLNIRKPLSLNQESFSQTEVRKIIRHMVEQEMEAYPDEISDYRDTFISNYVDTYSLSYAAAVNATADRICEDCETALDIVAELSNASGNKQSALKATYAVTGYDSVQTNGYEDMGQEGGTIYVAWFPEQIKATNNNGLWNGNDPRIYYQFIGEQGAANLDKAQETTHRLQNLAVARSMEDGDRDARSIKMATGWERGADGKWRYEIGDTTFQEKWLERKLRYEDDGKAWLLSDVLEEVFPAEIMAAYPALKRVQLEIRIDPHSKTNKGMFIDGVPDTEEYFGRWPEIVIFAPGIDEALKTLNHELQHFIQQQEGFAMGGSASSSAEELESLALAAGVPMPARVSDIKLALENRSMSEEAYKEIAGMARRKGFKNPVDYVTFLSPIEYYRCLGGEVEARNAERRMGMSAEERMSSLASDTADVASEDQIILFEGQAGCRLCAKLDMEARDAAAYVSHSGESSLPKGAIFFHPENALAYISLFKGRHDLSTIIHETGHFFLENLRHAACLSTAPEWVREDWQTVSRAIGADEDPTQPVPREAHEKFARMTETYFRKGEAPSPGLEGVFQRFGRWLGSIWEASRQCVKEEELDPGVKAVLDRMLTGGPVEAAGEDEEEEDCLRPGM